VKREKRLTKREQKALRGPRPGAATHQHEEHIHCIACGRHIEPAEFTAKPPAAVRLRCQHGGNWPACDGCAARAREMLALHDRTGQPVERAQAWH
jgi:hypothetical protein